MKAWFFVPLAALVGLVAGSWGPREDLAHYKELVQTAQTERRGRENAGFGAFANLTRIPDVAAHRPVATNVEEVVEQEAENGAEAGETSEPATNRVSRARPQRVSREDLRARIDEAAELWRTRVELAKTQWKGKLRLDGAADSAAFDSALADMNADLRESMEALADEIERVGRMTPELGLRLMGDLSRTMAETYDVLGASLPKDRRDELSEMPVYEFIDPSVAEPLIRVQDALGDSVSITEEDS